MLSYERFYDTKIVNLTSQKNPFKLMRNVRLYMIFQWVFFLPIILPLCLIYGAFRGAIQMVERVMEQIMTDIMPQHEVRSTTKQLSN